MADVKTKSYQIVINGLKESISAVDSLNKQLDALDERLKALENKSIKIAASSSGGGSKSSSKSSLTEEQKLAKQIEQIDRKREAYSKKIYQNYLAAKDVLKETENDQKQIAAQERLQADTYTNTMQGLKQKLADIKNVMQTTDIGEDIFKKYTKEANEITNKLKELEAAFGQFGRNVGNYASAADGFKKIKVVVGDTVREFDNYRQAMKVLLQERFQLADSLGRESKEFKEVDKAVRQLESSYKDLNVSSSFMDNMLDTMQGFTAMASIGTGFTTLFGINNEELNETIKKMSSLLMIMQGFEVINKQIKSGDNPILNWFKGLDDKLIGYAEKIGTKFGWKFAEKSLEEIQTQINEAIASGDFAKMEEEITSLGDKFVYGLFKKTDTSDTTDEYKTLVKAINDAGESGIKFSEIFKRLNDEHKGWVYSVIKGVDEVEKAHSKAFNVIVSGVKWVGRVIGGVIAGIGISYAIGLINDLIESIGNWVKGNADLVDSEKLLNTQIELTNYKLQERLRLNQVLEKANYLSVVEREIADEKAYADAIAASNQELIKRANIDPKNATFAQGMRNAGRQSGINDFLQNDKGTTTLGGFSEAAKDIDELIKRYNALSDAVEKNTGLTYKNAKGIEICHLTASDARDELNHLEQFLAGNMVGAMTQFDISTDEGRKGLEQFVNGILKSDDELYKSLLLRLPQLVSDNEGKFGTALDKYIELIKEFARQADQEMKQFKFSEMVENILDQADETGKRQTERRKKELTQRYQMLNAEQQKQEKQHYEQGLAALDKMQAKRQTKEIASAKETGDKLRAVENELIALRIENMKEGLEKQLAAINNERRLALQKARENGIKYGELELEINKKYDRKILEEKRRWAFEVIRTYEDLESRIIQLNKNTFDREANTASQNVEMKQNKSELSTGYSMITPTNYDDSKNLEAYYKKIIDIRKNAIEREAQIEQESLDKQYELNKREEELRHKRITDLNNGEFIQQLRNGKITQEQYDKLMEDEKDAHNAAMNALDKEYASNSEKVTQESLEQQRKLYSDYYGNIITNLRRDKSKIDEILSAQPTVDKAGWNIVNIGATNNTYKKALEEYDKLKNGVIKKQEELDADLKAGRIKPEDFAIRKEELDNELKGIDKSIQDLLTRQKSLIGEFVQSLMPYIQAVANSFNQIMSAVWSAQDTQFDKEQEALDKENEMLQEKLSKQESLISDYKSTIDSIEDELATSRGDRRQHLIDQLNAEMEAERRAQKEKERLQKEEERNKKKQEELEKKRKKAQYERDMIQAVVNGAMAVTMAAINKWPLPAIPMMALAASTTAAQLAIMASNKPYAKGGQLDGGVAVGNRHRDGGIKVLGGRAEIEGGEFITNRLTTEKNIDLLEFVNSKKKKIDVNDMLEFYSSGSVKKNIMKMSPKAKFADGGYIPPTLSNNIDLDDRLMSAFENYSNRPVVVSVVDITNKQAQVRNVQALAGLSE